MGFSRQRYWSGLPFPSLEALPDPRIKPASPALQVNSLPSETPGKPFWILTALYLFTAQDFNRSIPRIFLYFVTAICGYVLSEASLVAPKAKNLSAMQVTWVRPLGWEDPLEKGMATHSSILAWKMPWMEEPGRLQSMGSPLHRRVRHDWATNTLGIKWKE